MKDRIEASLNQMIATSGVLVMSNDGDGRAGTVLEPFVEVPLPSLIEALAFHLNDLFWHCDCVYSDTTILASSTAEPDIFDNTACSLWGSVDDMRFHAFQCPPYMERIREELLRANSMNDGRNLLPSRCAALRSQPFDSLALANAVALRTTLSHEDAAVIATDIADLISACQHFVSRAESFASSVDKELPSLGVAFADLTSAVLSLALVLQRADAAATSIMYNQCDKDMDISL